MILSDKDIRAAVDRGAIVIDPFRPECLGPNSYDVHLGPFMLGYNEGLLGRDYRASENVWEQTARGVLDARLENPVEEIWQVGNEGWLLLPGRVYLAATEEYTETHEHVPYLDGKSSVGRLGITIHATAGRGDVGFCNHWTMELVVAQPVRVYASMPIGQLTYHEVLSLPEKPYGSRSQSKYQGRDPMPQPSRMWKNFQKPGDV